MVVACFISVSFVICPLKEEEDMGVRSCESLYFALFVGGLSS